ncbi:hypothetical protein OM076_26350 [Solirubrobacter ginsenosidimutans]|uniref:PKD domain-containing protein n=1 Tax=Solirubrobacter ginsenosidimutans TaxID=490573 RepID=A0A9X3MYV8_9ACTN|nr:hypothetical protein [Solirubrobacter ginsenosidimutans]MDA0163820.1 hypothetical protein [Solirubrobacter ginsenosidimutans]
MKSGGRFLATAIVAAALCGPATANAAVSATVTGDDGQPAPLTAGAVPTYRFMGATAAVQVTPGAQKSWKWSVSDPTGALAASEYCWSTLQNDSSRVNYRGNGTYTLNVQLFSGSSCTGSVISTSSYQWTTAASVGIVPPAGPLMTRPANTLTTNTHLIDFAGNPGAQNYEVRFAKGAVLAPDGSISGPSETAIVDTTGKIRFWNFTGPGQYTMVARAQFGDYFTSWSPPVTITLVAPFDLSDVSFPDPRGPSYQLRGAVREATAAGSRVTVAVAKGKKGKRFRTLGKPKINSKGTFTLRFRLARGTYRVRYSFKGTSSVTRGSVYEVITVRRVLG